MKVGESVRSSSRHAWRCWDGFLLVFVRGGFGLGGPTAATFHRGGDSEATLPATGAPDDGTLLGKEPGAGTWPLYLLSPCPCPAGFPRTSGIRRGGGPGSTPLGLLRFLTLSRKVEKVTLPLGGLSPQTLALLVQRTGIIADFCPCPKQHFRHLRLKLPSAGHQD